MVPSSLIPEVIGISVDPIWPVTLSIVTLSVHLLLMNVVFGGTAIIFYHSLFGGTDLSRNLSGKLPTVLALAINAGVPPLLFLQAIYGQFSYVSSILMAVFWLAVVVALLAGYYGLYYHHYRYEKMNVLSRKVLIFGVLCTISYIGFMLSNKMTLMLRPEVWGAYLDNPDGLLLNLEDPVLIPRFLHFVMSAFAVGGLFGALIGKFKADKQFIEVGMKWFSRATVINIGMGFWFFLALPKRVIAVFMGQNLFATGLFCIGLVVTIGMLHAGFRKKVVQAATMTFFIVPVMVIMRHIVREQYLSSYFKLSDMPVSGEWSPMIFFFISLVIGTWVIIYMLKLMMKSERS